ncbi:nucleotide sugar dehydrogenase [Paenibacillus alginolyticus]|uniref:nucleotide sugar dehydrogenase n=1 Tax=Paenibacillus alginolyticus TaxID=59839 RepID=UPI0004195E46|nr:nucleotide sugar dehydrogenase [Paenibacillus alginolyticus]MCY9668262.1 nucleotide sugar dehydrogenase [Paenibacillus alginolyticus]
MPFNHLQNIAVIGLGYVGLPLAKLFLEKGHTVYGIDADKSKIKKLMNKQPYISDFTRLEITEMFGTGHFHVGSSFEVIREADSILLCVPTPIDKEAKPDLSFVLSAVEQIIPYLREGQLVVLESSTYPGTTEEDLKALIEGAGWEVGRNVYLAYSPERIDPGQIRYKLSEIPKVVGGVTNACTEHAKRVYEGVFNKVIAVSNARTAEMTKLIENYQRFVNISLMNDLVRICEAMSINLWEVIQAASTKPYGFMTYYPGPGVGGHCIPVDPMYLVWKAKQYNVDLPFIELSHQVNEEMPWNVVSRVEKALLPLTLAQSSIMVIGVTYKKNVNDLRESKALQVVECLIRRGASVSYYDPYFKEIEIADRKLKRSEVTAKNVKKHDCLLILTDHSGQPYELIAKHARLVVDTRNATASIVDKSNIILL